MCFNSATWISCKCMHNLSQRPISFIHQANLSNLYAGHFYLNWSVVSFLTKLDCFASVSSGFGSGHQRGEGTTPRYVCDQSGCAPGNRDHPRLRQRDPIEGKCLAWPTPPQHWPFILCSDWNSWHTHTHTHTHTKAHAVCADPLSVKGPLDNAKSPESETYSISQKSESAKTSQNDIWCSVNSSIKDSSLFLIRHRKFSRTDFLLHLKTHFKIWIG